MSDLPETPVAALRLLATQTEIDRFSDGLIQSVKEGESNPLEILIMLRAFEKVSKRVLSEIDENYLKEADKYPEKKFELFGATIEKAELGTKYDYTVCDDTIYERLEVEFEAAKRKLDERKEFLKVLKAPMPVIDDVTGECVTIKPPIKTSTTGLKVSIK